MTTNQPAMECYIENKEYIYHYLTCWASYFLETCRTVSHTSLHFCRMLPVNSEKNSNSYLNYSAKLPPLSFAMQIFLPSYPLFAVFCFYLTTRYKICKVALWFKSCHVLSSSLSRWPGNVTRFITHCQHRRDVNTDNWITKWKRDAAIKKHRNDFSTVKFVCSRRTACMWSCDF